jgi:hypothetical protein
MANIEGSAEVVDIANIPDVDEMQKCIFCIDIKEGEKTVPLKAISKVCNCNPPVHKSCIREWYIRAGKKCPICLKTYSSFFLVVRTDEDYMICGYISSYRIFQCSMFLIFWLGITGTFSYIR